MLDRNGGEAIDTMDAATSTRSDCIPIPGLQPAGLGHIDRVTYQSVHFYGEKLAEPLMAAAEYLRELELLIGKPPYVLCVHDEFSSEDGGSDLAWRVTLVLAEPIVNPYPVG
jgi:hypothetical protein